jgi:hypothetical protein
MCTPLGKPNRKWQVNFKMSVKELGCKGVDYILLTQDSDQWQALVNHGNEGSGFVKEKEFLNTRSGYWHL